MKILSIVGARPQFIKASVVSKAVRQKCREVLLHTGQHYDERMSQIFFEEMGIPTPDINLGVGSGTHAEQTSQMMTGIENVLFSHKPDWVVVYGDTNSTLAGSLAAAKLNIPVAHIEAGLRSYNRGMPEEVNRLVCDHLSQVLFCPTRQSVENLAQEGVLNGVYQIGDVMFDALLHYLPLAQNLSSILESLKQNRASYALATIHRAANTDDPSKLKPLLEALGQISLPVIFPLHPRTRKVISSLGLILPANCVTIDPVGYLDMLQLEANAECILTDSGGIQKEAYWLGIRCITLREETEWVETVAAGWNRLAGTDTAAILDAFNSWKPQGDRPAVYGDGQAAYRIAAVLETWERK